MHTGIWYCAASIHQLISVLQSDGTEEHYSADKFVIATGFALISHMQ